MSSWKVTDYLTGKRWEFDTEQEALDLLDKMQSVLGKNYPIILEYF